ncbi:MAG: hydroxymethylglutaryl-CoA reductase [Planctomycetia bacterium]|nr:hydroxymethylglutaryl-CoA reductase [Planctomycetia bacterium]
MAAPNYHARIILDRILQGGDPEQTLTRFRPRSPEEAPLPPRVPGGNDFSQAALDERRKLLASQGISLSQLSGQGPEIAPDELQGNIENYVGMARVPVGVIGPLRINGTAASGDFYVPLATTEGALVASYQRGAYVTSLAGGAVVCCLTESVARAPCFAFANLSEVGRFIAATLPRYEQLQEVVSGTSRFCRLLDLKINITGKEVYVIFEFTTGDAAGQNMVTIATEALCSDILAHSPVQPAHWYLDGNLSGDKKATMQSFTYARGKKVVAEAIIPAKLVRRFLRAEPADLVRYWQVSFMGGTQSGSIGSQGHFANALAGLFLACGQDAACVAEAAVGTTRMDLTDAGELYVSVSLPGLIVGTVGGGTRFPTARECLEMIGCYGTGQSRKFAEICCATVLAGEISIVAAMAAGDFGRAHAAYGRKRQ